MNSEALWIVQKTGLVRSEYEMQNLYTCVAF